MQLKPPKTKRKEKQSLDARLDHLFDRIDADGSGTIDAEELIRLLVEFTRGPV